ncbi:MAG: aspartate aminotransferase family protein [Candidatus Korarchaeota archaeon]|nr:aspartate aminotransferase family protein [Candidatus Korarchaeota archaeon]NIU83738.1 aminotransferase class III-fold pyridoxal phosphate-dependent enzyme [Candidatus Thorarchaeota archaeon]NIW15691.1 aminotransferase class III-fold pyridoxal phosphate-dependent enzyme [Candidatus Thorarchaeota archaeon]NIW52055.1 aminotransferase class III-fold pyridoxal phosphate-dependent enzyme [Candidatus Korarchaeota archaeon]
MKESSPKTWELLKKEKENVGRALWIRFYPIVVKAAQGAKVTGADGKQYLDFNAGWAVMNTGYKHPNILKALKKQVDELVFSSYTTFPNEASIKLAEELAEITPGDFKKKVWFGLTGSDANECIYKLLPLYKERKRFVTFVGSYHGQNMGALSLSGHKATSKLVGFGNVVRIPYPYCYRCPFDKEYPECGLFCFEYIKDFVFKNQVFPEDVAGCIYEPIQSDGGDIVPPDGFLEKLQTLCRDNGIEFIADEVKVGMGRTGTMFGSENWNLEPDVNVLGKPLASGMPLSAIVAPQEMVDVAMGTHLFTLSGHPISSAAALATIKTIKEENLADNAKSVGEYFLKRLKELKDKHEAIGDVRGKGLILGVELVKDRKTKEPATEMTAKVVYRAKELGLLLAYVGMFSNVIEITPPLTITKEQVDTAVEIIDQAIKDVQRGVVSDEAMEFYKGW